MLVELSGKKMHFLHKISWGENPWALMLGGIRDSLKNGVKAQKTDSEQTGWKEVAPNPHFSIALELPSALAAEEVPRALAQLWNIGVWTLALPLNSWMILEIYFDFQSLGSFLYKINTVWGAKNDNLFKVPAFITGVINSINFLPSFLSP